MLLCLCHLITLTTLGSAGNVLTAKNYHPFSNITYDKYDHTNLSEIEDISEISGGGHWATVLKCINPLH